MSVMAAPVRARWFDPATGTYLAISEGYEFANERTRTFTTPGMRGDGTDDWLLVLDSTGKPRCGTITATGVYTAPPSVAEGIDCEVTATLESDPSAVARTKVTLGSRPAARWSVNPTALRRTPVASSRTTAQPGQKGDAGE